ALRRCPAVLDLLGNRARPARRADHSSGISGDYWIINGSRDRQQISKLEAQLTAYDQEKGRAEALLNQPQNRVIRDRSRFLNSLFQRKAFSWTRVFEDLERVMPAHLHVVSIHPDMSSDN